MSAGNAKRRHIPLVHDLRLVKQQMLMTIGIYNEPAGAYLPSILY